MLWVSCASHEQYAGSLDEEKTSTLVSAGRDRTGMRYTEYSVTWSFDPANAYSERHLLDQYLSILNACATPQSDVFAAELIYRELVGNALRHAPGTVEVELRWSEPYAILNVDDQWDLFPWSGEAPHNPLSDHGRGLYLVKSFARELRIKDWRGSGHKISAVLPVKRKSDIPNLFDFPNDASQASRDSAPSV
jgi:anti-sigma regulatory factor (Ser/Thr protein kinase)